MTKQIVIKLNEKRFKPLLDSLIMAGCDTSKNYHECVGKTLFFVHEYVFRECKELNNKTKKEFIMEALSISKDTYQIEFLSRYNKFLKTGLVGLKRSN